ncbi:alpha/beta hydrolase [Pseudomonas bohemica]|uniref:alpha/beta hydrolase n=1 Tax=Pseudomonas bohemica TaxID=2044872 RepID=UPI000DA61A73|nr:alpha/beta hydrolase-fold protein [Pseudomonas bohemica]
MNWIRSLTFTLLSALPFISNADNQEIHPLAETGSAHYRFERMNIESPDGQRHYRLDIGIPRTPPPASGYPAMYLLDGNNVRVELQEGWLGELNAGSPPLLVMIGYDIDGTYDGEQRTRDYTGATSRAFLQLIESKIKPEVQTRYSVDPARQTLWGHSFGGLFVLYALLQQPQAFQTWIAASASLWYQPITFDNGMALKAFPTDTLRTVRLVQGEREGKPPIAQFDGGSPERRREMSAVPRDASRLLAEHLATLPGTEASYQAFNGRNHGQMFGTALHLGLRRAAGLPEQP